jgi:hypothetical protein
MGIDIGRIVYGCSFLLLLGPALWLPSLLGWNLQSRTLAFRLGVHDTQETVAISSQVNWFVTGDRMRGDVAIRDKATGAVLRLLRPSVDTEVGFSALAVSPEGDCVAATSDENCFIWEIGAK